MVCAEPLQMQVLRDALMGWWQEHGRQTIPWKLNLDGSLPATGEQLHPYAIWVAEVMLQQTQLKVVLPYWQRSNVAPSPWVSLMRRELCSVGR